MAALPGQTPPVELVRMEIERIVPEGVSLSTALAPKADIICDATGLPAHEFLAPMEVWPRRRFPSGSTRAMSRLPPSESRFPTFRTCFPAHALGPTWSTVPACSSTRISR